MKSFFTILLLSSFIYAVDQDKKSQVIESYKHAMIEASKKAIGKPGYGELARDLNQAAIDLKAQVGIMSSGQVKTIPQIWPKMSVLRKHEAYPELDKKIKLYIKASHRRLSFFYLHDEKFKKAMDEFREVQGKDKFIPDELNLLSQKEAPTHQDISYGEHQKELINFWAYKSDKPVGILLHIHGGGWMGGAKTEGPRPKHFKGKYHFASISYPLVNEGGQQPQMLNAALRAVQFIRSKAKEWNIDPQRIVLTGGSAGGCSSLLVALHDDVAKVNSTDPVERYSSRVAGAVVAGAQTTMNPFIIKERIGEKTFGNPMPYKPFGAQTIQELMNDWGKYKNLVLKCSPLTHLSKDDPPLHLFYNVNREFPTSKSSNGIHSPIFGEMMLEACKEIGVECYLQYWEKDRPQPELSREQFLNRLLLN